MSQNDIQSSVRSDFAGDPNKLRKIKTKEEAFHAIDLYLNQEMPFEVFNVLYSKSEMLQKKFSFLLMFHRFWFQSYLIFDSVEEIVSRFRNDGAIITIDSAYTYMRLSRGQHPIIDQFLQRTIEGKTIFLPVTDKQVEIIKISVPDIMHRKLKLSDLMYLTLLPYSQLLAIIFDL